MSIFDGEIFDGAIDLWDVATSEHIRTLTGHTDEVNSIAFSPDGKKSQAEEEDLLTGKSIYGM